MNAIYLEEPTYSVDVLESGAKCRKNSHPCIIGSNIKFSTQALESFSSTNWQPVIFDLLLVSAAVEFCDRSKGRNALNWGRRFDLKIPVHEPERWNDKRTHNALHAVLNLLTGDSWSIDFVSRKNAEQSPRQALMEFPMGAEAVIAFSEGMDSSAVAGLEGQRLGPKLVRVRVGTKDFDVPKSDRAKQPFTAVPYKVKLSKDNAETSARSRGFKFATVSAIAAYLIKAQSVIVPESGQGALAPAILPVGQAYPDYRNHPLFTERMEDFVFALLGHHLHYQFPRLWSTKSETLKAFVAKCPEGQNWRTTRSCWQQQRQASVLGEWRQCGVCAACLLRRMSVHAAGLEEPASNYVWEDLSVAKFEDGAHPAYDRKRITKSMYEYALGGVMHFDHLATLQNSPQYALVKRRAENEIARSLDEPHEEISLKMDRLLATHAKEWRDFTDSLGEKSFLRAWIDRRQ